MLCVRHRPWSTISKIFSETAWPIKAKLHVEHPWEGGTKVYINGPGHMTKMTAMVINSKNLKKKTILSTTRRPMDSIKSKRPSARSLSMSLTAHSFADIGRDFRFFMDERGLFL